MMKYLVLVLTVGGLLISFDYFFNERGWSETTVFEIDKNISTDPKAKVVKSGLFKVIRSGGLVKSKQTSTGKAISKPVIQLVKETERIPLVKDAHMSLQYRIWNLSDKLAYIKLRRVLKHPLMTLPDGNQSSGSDYMITGKVSVGQVVAYTGYGLNEDYEMLEGEWTFQIWHQHEKLIEHTFVTYNPTEEEKLQLGSLSPPRNNLRFSASNIDVDEVADGINKKQTPSAAKRNWIN